MTKKKKASKPPKLPVQQLMILSICRLAEPVALTSVFPYLPEMMEFLGVQTSEVAYYAGLTAAIFSLCQVLTGVPWGLASDRFGRKPVILTGMTCTMLTSILFGFSRSLPWAMTARAFAGLGNGNVGVIRTTVAEMVPQRELQPRAFSIMPLIWVIGSIFGPSFGGFFANPTKSWNWDNQFFRDYPYLLPNLIASVLFLVGLTTGILFLHETLETKKSEKDYGLVLGKRLSRPFSRKLRKITRKYRDAETTSLLHSSASSSSSSSSMGWNGVPKNGHGEREAQSASVKPPGYREVFSRQATINLLVYCLLSLHSVAFDQLLSIFLHHPVQDHSDNNPEVTLPLKFSGGFGLDSNGIGLIFTCYGVFGMLGQFLVFPPVARRAGILNCLKGCAFIFPVIYILVPFTVLFETSKGRTVAVLILMVVKSLATVHAFPSSTILLTNSAVSLRTLGTLNGFATSVSAIGRAAGPAIGGSTFSLGVRKGYIIVPWWTMAGLAVIGAIPTWWLVESEGFGDDDDEESSDGEEDDSEAERHRSDEHEASDDESFRSTNENAFEGENEDENDDVLGAPLSRVTSSSTGHKLTLRRTVSNPIGLRGTVGPPGTGRRLSTNLGTSNSGFGTGGTSWH